MANPSVWCRDALRNVHFQARKAKEINGGYCKVKDGADPSQRNYKTLRIIPPSSTNNITQPIKKELPKMNDKIPDKELLFIKEFSELVGVNPATLRHYDEKEIFSPVKRGGELNTQYRYYAPSQITAIKMIRVLVGIGVPFEAIKKLSKKRTPEKLLKMLSQCKDNVAHEIRYLQESHAIIETFTDLLCEGICANESEITIAEMQEKPIILGDVADFGNKSGFMQGFLSFCNGSHRQQVNTSFPIGAYFDSFDNFANKTAHPTRFFSIDPRGNDKKPAGLYLIGYTRAYYGKANDLPQRMKNYAKNNDLKFTGPVYNIYLSDEVSEVEQNNYLLQVSAPVTETWYSPSRNLE